MKKYIVLAMIVVLSGWLIAVAGDVGSTGKTAEKSDVGQTGKAISTDKTSTSPGDAEIQGIPKEVAFPPAQLIKETKKLNVQPTGDPAEKAAAEAALMQAEPAMPTDAEQKAADRRAEEMERQALPAGDAAVLDVFQAPAEPEVKWQPQYSEKGELLNPEPSVGQYSIPSQGDPDIPIVTETQLFFENFNGLWNGAPAGWTASVDDGGGFWDNYDWGRYASTTWGVAYARNASASSARWCDDWVISPSINFTGATACSLNYRFYYDAPASGQYRQKGEILLSDDGGVTWASVIASMTASTVDSGTLTAPLVRRRDISAFAAGKSDIKVGFHFFKDSLFAGNYFGFDNVEFTKEGVTQGIQTFDETGWGWQTGNASWVAPLVGWAGWTARDLDEYNAGWWNNNDWHGWYYSATGFADTVADIFYIPDEFARDKMTTPSINCSAQTNVHLRFKHFYDDMVSAIDTAFVLGSADNWATTQVIAVYEGADQGTSTAPATPDYDISSWAAGQSDVKIAFQWISGGTGTSRSWVIDRVELYAAAAHDVGVTAILGPTYGITGINAIIKNRVFNFGVNTETFTDSARIEQPIKNVLLTQNFNSPTGWTGANPPTGWVVLDSGSTPGVWDNIDWHQYYWSTGGDTVARVLGVTGTTNKTWLISPSVNASALSNLYLSFRTWYNWEGTTDTAYIYGTTDNWATFVQIDKWYSDHGGASSLGRYTYDISSWALGQANVKIAFRYVGAYDLYWYVDDVELYEVTGTTTFYTSAETVTGLASFASSDVTFATPWVPSSAGDYTLRKFTYLATDEVASNNSMSTTVPVYAHMGTGGPDAGYYYWKDSYVAGGPTFSWRDITAIGTPVDWVAGSTDDSVTARIPMGFSFPFYDSLYNRIFISENGFVSFDTITTGSANQLMPSVTTPNNLITLLWDDLEQQENDTPPNGQAFYYTNNVDTFIVSFINWSYYTSADTLKRWDAQVILTADQKIVMQYQAANPADFTASHSIGIEKIGGTAGLTYMYNDAPTGNRLAATAPLAVQYYYLPPPRDVVMNPIVAPTGIIVNGASFVPAASFVNNGEITETFDLIFKIFDATNTAVYNQTVTGVSIDTAVTDTVEFPSTSIAINGAYSCSTYFVWTGVPDPNPGNDKKRSTFTVDQHYGLGGPDLGLYKWIDNTVADPNAPVFGWVDISGDGTQVSWANKDDDTTGAIAMGFASGFTYYGRNVQNIKIGCNGFLTFLGFGTTGISNYNMPSASAPREVLSPMWDDLYGYLPTSQTYYKYDAANNRFIVSWLNWSSYTDSAHTFNMQAILDADDSSIVFQYDAMNVVAQYDFTVGIQDSTRTKGLSYYYGSSITLPGTPPLNIPYGGLAIKFYKWTPTLDVAAVSYDAPTSGMVGVAAFPSVTVRNTGLSATTADVRVKIIGPAPATDTVFNFMETTPSIPSGTTTAFAFTVNSWNPAASGSYSARVTVTTAGDEIPGNATVTGAVFVLSAPVTIPFSTDFEASNGTFVGLTEWEWGIPTLAPPAGPVSHSGTKLWGTDLDSRYENTTLNSLYSPPLDLAGQTGAWVKFWMWDSLETNYDGSNVSISTNWGATWSVITTSVPYNGTGYSTAPGMAGEPCWTGFFNWTLVDIDLIPFVGDTVLLRFDESSDGSGVRAGFYIDDFSLELPPPIDVSVNSIDAPLWITLPGPHTVTATLENNRATIATIDSIVFKIDSAAVNMYTGTLYSQVINPGTTQYSSPSAWNSTFLGGYTVSVTAYVTGDGVPSNNSRSAGKQIQAAFPFGHVENLTSSANWWAYYIGTGAGFYYSSTYYHSPSRSLYLSYSPAPRQVWISSPPYEVASDALIPKVRFWEFTQYWGDEPTQEFGVGVLVDEFDLDSVIALDSWTQATHTPGTFAGAPLEYDLSAYMGHTVWVILYFTSVSTANSANWYWDDVGVIETAIANIGITPASISHVMETDVTNIYVGDYTISNTGTAPLTWNSTNTFSWITPSLIGGIVPIGGNQAIDLTINSTGIAQGVYNDNIVVTSNDPDQPSISVPVTVTVTQVIPRVTTIDVTVFEGEQQVVPLWIDNASNATVHVTLTANQTPPPPPTWLTVAPLSADIPANDSLQAQVTVDATHLPVGSYTGTITVTSSNLVASVITIPVNFDVAMSGCDYMVGDINGNGAANGIDVVYGVTYLKGGAMPKDTCDCRPDVPTYPFYGAMDVNGNCATNGIDITFFVAYLKQLQPALKWCLNCPPASALVAPAVEPPAMKARKVEVKGMQ